MSRVSTFLSTVFAFTLLATPFALAAPQKKKKEKTDPAIEALDAFIKKATIDHSDALWKTKLPKPPVVGFTAQKEYIWALETSKGEILVRLLPEVAPMHVSSTIYLTQLGFYDKLAFHRVIPGFMAQGGCPLGLGSGDPGYKYAGEFDPSVKHNKPGLLSMANAGPDTDGSQFFLTFVPTPHLDGKHTIFGEVIGDGLEVMTELEASGSPSGRPSEPLSIVKATIRVQDATGNLPSAKDSDTAALAAMKEFIDGQEIDKEKSRWKTKLAKPPQLTFEKGQKYFWNILTNKGLIRVELTPEHAPMHVSSTIYLSRIGYYDDLAFHRVIPGFMAQGGCPLGRGTGNPGYKFEGEFDASVMHDKPGILSMANYGPGTDGSQFFLTFVPTPHLNGKHTIFGRVADKESLKVLKELEKFGSPGGRTSEEVKMIRTTISLE